MASTAISAQGSVVRIATGTGAAKTVSGASAGFPTIIQATAHGFGNGNVVALSGLSGNAGINGSFVVKNVTADTFAIELDTTGNTLSASSATATPSTYTQVNNIKTFSGFDGQASEIDVSNLSSAAKEYRLGLVDPGQFSMELDQDNADAGQLALRAAQVAGTLQQFTLTLPNGKVASFNAFVKKFSSQGGVDQVVKGQVDLRISGAVTWA